MREETVLDSLNQALHHMMASDARVIVIGEDVLDPYGGAFKVTKGLSARFSDRVITTPISEAAIIGTAAGMAIRGLRPIAEIMFGDFLLLGADQLVNHAAKFRWMYNDAVRVPMVVRTPMGGRRGYGPTHSQCLEKLFMGVPGLWVVAPHILSSPGDLLIQAALECDDPVVFVESKTCYPRPLESGLPGMTSEEYSDEASPFPTRYLHHARGSDGVLWCYGGTVPFCLEAVRHLAEVEDLHIGLVVCSQLSPVPESHISWVVENARPSSSFYVEESSTMFGWSAEVLAQVERVSIERLSDRINHQRIGATYTPVPSSRHLEQAALPQTTDIVNRILECF